MTLNAHSKAGLVVNTELFDPGCQQLIADADRIFREDTALTNNVLTALRDETPLQTAAEQRLENITKGLLVATTNCMYLDFTEPVEPFFKAADHQQCIREFRNTRNKDRQPELQRRLGLSLLVCYTRSLLDEEQVAATQNHPPVA